MFILATLLAFSIVKNGASSKVVFFQLLLIFFLLRNVYYLGTKNVMPFGDAYWDYAVENIFLEEGQISTIEGVVRPTEAGGISQLTWYSGWPFLHVLGNFFSMITGIDILYLNWILPNFLALVSFAFAYLLFEKLRTKLNLPQEITFISLFLFTITPEAIFWQMQFVRQSLALTLLFMIFYLLYTISFEKIDRRYFLILVLLILSLGVTHHVTAFTLALFLLLFSLINTVARMVGRRERLRWIFSAVRIEIFANLGFLMLISMVLWWYRNSNIIFPTITSRLILFFETLGLERIYSQVVTTYPAVINPAWVPPLLGFRDLMIYVPAVIGLWILWRNKSNFREKFFIIYSVVAFVFILFINFTFRIEPLRIIMFLAPFFVFLSALVYNKIHVLSKLKSKIIMFSVLVLLVCTSFLGLWAHSFAPIHLYDPSIDLVEIGEATPDFLRLKSFFENRINVTEIQVVRADVVSQLVCLLDPADYDKIKPLPIEDLDQLQGESTLVISFNDLNLYQYFGYVWSPVEASEARTIQLELKNYLKSNFSRIYDDGSSCVWVSYQNHQAP